MNNAMFLGKSERFLVAFNTASVKRHLSLVYARI